MRQKRLYAVQIGGLLGGSKMILLIQLMGSPGYLTAFLVFVVLVLVYMFLRNRKSDDVKAPFENESV